MWQLMYSSSNTASCTGGRLALKEAHAQGAGQATTVIQFCRYFYKASLRIMTLSYQIFPMIAYKCYVADTD